MIEQWKDISNYEGLYQISNMGRVRNNKGIVLTNKTTGKYNHILLCKNGDRKNFTIHRLVAEAFVPNINNYPIVNHINENSQDNRASNLEWCTQKYNINYGSRTQKAISKQKRKILQYDLKGNFIREWDGVNEAIRTYNNNYHISDVLNNKRSNASGYIWKFKEGKI